MFPLKSLLLILLLALPAANCLADAQSEFKQGVKSFKQKKFKTAITHFERARKQGLETAALYHNMAASYFKLGNLDQAERYFKVVHRDPKMKMLAEYNLGLIALNRKQKQTALKYFNTVSIKSKDKKLVAKANIQISRLTRPAEKNWSAYAEINYGYDDNITTVDETSTKRKDHFREVYASGDFALTGTSTNGIILNGFYFESNYLDENAYDFQIYGAGISKSFTLATWENSVGIETTKSNYGHADFQRVNKFELNTEKSLSKQSRIRFRYRYDDISSQTAVYDYLNGSRQRIRAEYKDITSDDYLRIYYELEFNDRLDTLTQSYSPLRHTLRGKYIYDLTDKISLGADLSYRISTYPAISPTTERTDKRTKASVKLAYKVNKTLAISAKHTITDTESNDPAYNYQRNVTSLTLEASF